MSTKHFYIFRHGQTDWNKEKLLQGSKDMPLNNTGREQATRLIPFFQSNNINTIYTSPLSRALETATIVSDDTIKIEQCDNLRERNYGVLEGKRLEDVREEYGINEEFHSFAESVDTITVPCEGLEKREDFLQRITNQLIKIAEQDSCDNIGISTHGGVVYVFLKSLGAHHFPKNGQIAEIVFDNNDFKFKQIHSLT